MYAKGEINKIRVDETKVWEGERDREREIDRGRERKRGREREIDRGRERKRGRER